MYKLLNRHLGHHVLKYSVYCNRAKSGHQLCGNEWPLGWTHMTDTTDMTGWRIPWKRFAGHSKWANIKHTKLSKDAEKSRTINRILTKLRFSLRTSQSTDPKINKEFGDVMEMCRKHNIANTTIDKAVKRALEKKCIPIKLEILGPNGCLLVVDAECDNRSALRAEIKKVLKKYNGFGFVDDGRGQYIFEEKGVVRIKDKDTSGQTILMEKAEEVAIEGDAEEVRPSTEDESVILFISDIQNFHKTKTYIAENTNYEIIESGIELLPHNRVELPEESLQIVVNAIEELEDLGEINRVYNNIS